MDESILVTGGAGAIGCNLARRLAKDKKKVVVLDNLSSGYSENIEKSENILFIRGDITKEKDLEKAFSHNISAIFHLAAHFANQNSVEHPIDDMETNAMGTLRVLEYAARKKIKKFIYASTSCVYGDKGIMLKEDLPDFKPSTPYSISKLAGEKYVEFFGRQEGLKFCVLRYFNVYGPGEMPGAYRNVIPNFFYRAMKGEPLVITGTGEETRDFTYVDDVVKGTIKAFALREADGDIFNIASGVETKIIEVAGKINEITGNKKGILFSKRRDWDNITRRSAETEKAKRVLGYEVEVGLDEGLKKTYEWLRKNIRFK